MVVAGAAIAPVPEAVLPSRADDRSIGLDLGRASFDARRVRRRLPIACVLILSSGIAAGARADLADERSFPCVGRWQGVGRTTGFPSAWTIDMTVTPPDGQGRCGTIEYTNPACGGTMEACRVDGGRVRVRERYTHTDRCAPAAELEFHCAGDRMEWAWVGWEVARSTLTRVGPAPETSARMDGREPSVPEAQGREPIDGPVQPPVDRQPRAEGGAPAASDAFGCGCAAHGVGARSPLAALLLAGLVPLARRRRRARRASR